MKLIIISFDYELFFGIKAGSVYNTLILPTNKMMDSLESIGAKGTYFVDYLMIKKLRDIDEEKARKDLLLIEKQLVDIVKRGHRVELHIHPHWLDAKYLGNGEWDFSDFSHYSLADLPSEQVNLLFREGVGLLTKIVRQADANYRILAYRAGGWAIQPFYRMKEAFLECGILIDSSVAPGMTINRHNGKEPDFSMISSNEIYSFSNQIEKKECGGEFLEVPITTCKMTIFDKIANRFYINRHNMEFIPFADGTHSRVVMRKQSRIYRMLNFIKYCLIPNRIMFSMTRISPNIILQKVLSLQEKILVFIDHPKDMSLSNIKVVQKLKGQGTFVTYEYFSNR